MREERVEKLFASTQTLARAWKSYFYKVLGTEKITPTQMGLLFYLGVHQPVNGRSIAAALYLSPSALTQQLDALEQLGFIVRETAREDRRITNISLSDSGKDKLATLDDKRRKFFLDVTASLEDGEIEALTTIQEKMQQQIMKYQTTQTGEQV